MYDSGVIFYGEIRCYSFLGVKKLICDVSVNKYLIGFLVITLREKEDLKKREEAWLKIDELARKNPDVSIIMLRNFLKWIEGFELWLWKLTL